MRQYLRLQTLRFPTPTKFGGLGRSGLIAPRAAQPAGGQLDFHGWFYYVDPSCERCGPGLAYWHYDDGSLSGAGQRPWGPF
jgi:hypothetical protein